MEGGRNICHVRDCTTLWHIAGVLPDLSAAGLASWFMDKVVYPRGPPSMVSFDLGTSNVRLGEVVSRFKALHFNPVVMGSLPAEVEPGFYQAAREAHWQIGLVEAGHRSIRGALQGLLQARTQQVLPQSMGFEEVLQFATYLCNVRVHWASSSPDGGSYPISAFLLERGWQPALYLPWSGEYVGMAMPADEWDALFKRIEGLEIASEERKNRREALLKIHKFHHGVQQAGVGTRLLAWHIDTKGSYWVAGKVVKVKKGGYVVSSMVGKHFYPCAHLRHISPLPGEELPRVQEDGVLSAVPMVVEGEAVQVPWLPADLWGVEEPHDVKEVLKGLAGPPCAAGSSSHSEVLPRVVRHPGAGEMLVPPVPGEGVRYAHFKDQGIVHVSHEGKYVCSRVRQPRARKSRQVHCPVGVPVCDECQGWLRQRGEVGVVLALKEQKKIDGFDAEGLAPVPVPQQLLDEQLVREAQLQGWARYSGKFEEVALEDVPAGKRVLPIMPIYSEASDGRLKCRWVR
jgi:hypothetical protein